MSILVVGLNHRTSPIGLLEQLTIGNEQLPKALHQLRNAEHVLESVVLSTCNRTEVYAVVSRFHAGAQDLRNFLSDFCHVAPEEFVDHMYTYHDENAVRHLFRVSAGIDSLIVGESEILGQVRRSFQTACDEGAAHRVLGGAFRRALAVGKRARASTGIGRNPASVSSAAVDLARRAFRDGSLEGKTVAVIGAGKMGRLATRALSDAGAGSLVIVNRTETRATELADAFAGTSLPMDDATEAIAQADIVICSTTAPETVVSFEMVRDAMKSRPDRSLFIVDIAVPRDVDVDVAQVENVILRDIDDLKGVVDSGIGSRMAEVTKVEDMINEDLQRFLDWERSLAFQPTAAALVEKVDQIRAREVERIKRHVDQMTPEQASAVDHLSRRLVAKILHAPLTKARDLADPKQGHIYLAALRELFELDDDESDPV